MAEMRIDILTLFPGTVDAVLHESILGRAARKGILDIRCWQIRDYTENRQCQVDDYPYGGGFGCVMMAQPLKACLDAATAGSGDLRRRVIYLSPQGRPFTQATARRLRQDYDQLVLVCGHYEGVDERFIEACVDEEISLGDFVLTGGEIAAMAVADAVCRLVPGVLSDPQCYIGESHWDGLLEYPQYTRPETWEGRAVPEVLLNGDHEKVGRWRRLRQFERTRDKRPDLFRAFEPATDEDRALLKELRRAEKKKRLTDPVTCRPAGEEDLPCLLQIREEARRSLARHGVDQWQGTYPAEEDFRREIAAGECFLVLHGGETAAFFTLSVNPEPGYDGIRDGRWSEPPSYAVLRHAAVAAAYRGSGLAEALLRLAEDRTRALGRRSIRTATHRKNKPALRLLRETGYRYRGNADLDTEPGHDPARQCYEKLLKEKKQ
ncbi:MAG: tRNA (guanosine(37)-N1)-methyltransferase TrmD [Oscillospiraceae bacterium]|nr:tRNA (guanosine(37)-N1)-methyltransferase TrmD [Oscillospiraceae bacterium]